MSVASPPRPVGELLRDWRQRRRLSQLDLSVEAEVSARHLSFVETGRSKPSRELLLHLAEHLDVPLRERNAWLLAAGYAPLYQESQLDADHMEPVERVFERWLEDAKTGIGAAKTHAETFLDYLGNLPRQIP